MKEQVEAMGRDLGETDINNIPAGEFMATIIQVHAKLEKSI